MGAKAYKNISIENDLRIWFILPMHIMFAKYYFIILFVVHLSWFAFLIWFLFCS